MTEGMPPPQAFAIGISIALKILSSRALAFLALIMSFGLFSWCMLERSVISFVAATTFSVVTYLPALWRDRGSNQ
jgi:hypothetical protein